MLLGVVRRRGLILRGRILLLVLLLGRRVSLLLLILLLGRILRLLLLLLWRATALPREAGVPGSSRVHVSWDVRVRVRWGYILWERRIYVSWCVFGR